MAKASSRSASRISRDDLEQRFSALQGDIKSSVANRKQKIMTGAGVAVAVLLMMVFLLGKRSGKRKSTWVEIRRV
jgi:hypothetical protein